MSKLRELFRFVEGSTVYTQTSGPVDVSYMAETYASAYPISRTAVEQKNELTRAGIEIKTSLNNPVAIRYLADPVDSVVTLTVFQEVNGTPNVFWKGRLSSVKASGKDVTLVFESFFTSLRRPGLRAIYQKSCRHALYGRGCFLNPEDWKFETTVSDMTGKTVTVASVDGASDNVYRGGMIRAPDTSVRFIVSQIGTLLTLSRTFQTLRAAFEADGPGMVDVKIYLGCAHTLAACIAFGNVLNYGGFPWIPNKNPMAGSSIA